MFDLARQKVRTQSGMRIPDGLVIDSPLYLMQNDAVDDTTETSSEQNPGVVRRPLPSFLRSTFVVVCGNFPSQNRMGPYGLHWTAHFNSLLAEPVESTDWSHLGVPGIVFSRLRELAPFSAIVLCWKKASQLA